METKLKIRARFFSGAPIETREVIVDDDGRIYVWDEVADHYTTCHSLARSAERRIRKQASTQAPSA